MLDFTISEIPSYGFLYCGLLFFTILGIYWRSCVLNPSIKKRPFAIIVLFGLFATTWWVNTDFFGYMTLVKSYYPGIGGYHMEKVYEYIIQFTNNNYLFFRVFVWGGAILCFALATKVYKVDTTLSMFIMFLLYTNIFSYARVSLAMAVFYFGLSVLSSSLEKKRIVFLFLGLAIIASSYLFHKSMIIMIMLTGFYFVPISRKSIVPIVALILVVGVASDLIMNNLMIQLSDLGDEQLVEKMERNNEVLAGRKQISASVFGWILLVWEYLTFYIPFLIISKIMLNKSNNIESRSMVGLYRLTFFVISFSTMMLIFGTQSFTYFYRFLYMSFIPLSILTAYLIANGYMSKSKYRIIIYLCGGYNIWTFFTYLFR